LRGPHSRPFPENVPACSPGRDASWFIEARALDTAQLEALVAGAAAARRAAYAPYSHYAVGAALMDADGNIFTGCNVENAAYGLSMCAERNALFHAVAEGSRAFTAIAVVTANGGSPCGSCRQALAEFSPGMAVILVDGARHATQYRLDELLPHFFGPADLPGEPG